MFFDVFSKEDIYLNSVPSSYPPSNYKHISSGVLIIY